MGVKGSHPKKYHIETFNESIHYTNHKEYPTQIKSSNLSTWLMNDNGYPISIDLFKSSKKGYETKPAIQSTTLNFPPFCANTQCLIRQDVWLLREKLNMIYLFIIIIISIFYFQARVIHQQVIPQISSYKWFSSNFIPYKLYANVLVMINKKHVKSL
jgi:hypothetical protein